MNDRLAELHEDGGGSRATSDPVEIQRVTTATKTKPPRMPKILTRARKRARLSRRRSSRADSTEELSQTEHMKRFFDCIEVISKQISEVSVAAQQIILLKDRAVLASSQEEETKINNDIRRIVEDANGQAHRCKTLLSSLKKENDKEGANLQEKGKPTDLRLREHLVNTLLRQFCDEMKNYQSAQEQYKTDLKKKVTRQIQLVRPGATDQDVDKIMRSEGGREALLQELILCGVSHEIKTEFQAVVGRYQEVLDLEHSAAELHQMFLDLALLTEHQGGLLDHIECQLGCANDSVMVGNEELHESILLQKKLRKKRLRVLLLVAGVAIIIVLISVL